MDDDPRIFVQTNIKPTLGRKGAAPAPADAPADPVAPAAHAENELGPKAAEDQKSGSGNPGMQFCYLRSSIQTLYDMPPTVAPCSGTDLGMPASSKPKINIIAYYCCCYWRRSPSAILAKAVQ